MTHNPKYSLQFFAEDGAAVDSGFATGDTGEAPEGAQGTEPASGNEETWDSLTGKGGKYHKDFNNAVRSAVNKRFKNQADNQTIIDRMNPVLAIAAQRYGITQLEDGSFDYEALQRAIEDDNSLYEKEAFDRGMNVEDLKQLKQAQMKNQQLERQLNAHKQQEESDRLWAELNQEAEEVKEFYPDFNLNEELNDPSFGRMLANLQRSGFQNALRTAYEVVHKDEILQGGMRYARQRAMEDASRAVASGSRRPKENGTSGRAPSTGGQLNPANLKLKDFAAIKARAERGERISFS